MQHEHDFPTTPRGHVLTSTGIAIGSAWTPPAAPQSRDAEQIQAGLLGDAEPPLERVAGAFERLGPYLFTAVCVFAAIAAAVKHLVPRPAALSGLGGIGLLMIFVLLAALLVATLARCGAPRWVCLVVSFLFAAFIRLMGWL